MALAMRHEAAGFFVAVLPMITEQRRDRTPLGPPPLIGAIVRVTWHLVGLLVANMFVPRSRLCGR